MSVLQNGNDIEANEVTMTYLVADSIASIEAFTFAYGWAPVIGILVPVGVMMTENGVP